MLKDLLAYVLPLLAWGALSGVLNLLLTRKSQIEAWVNVHPRLAAWSKLLRSIGFDPWAAHAWLTLLVKKKLPEAQQADSPIAQLEQRKADAKRLGGGDEPPTGEDPVGPAGPPPWAGSFPPSSKLPGLKLSRWLPALAALGVFLAMVLLPFVAGCSSGPAKVEPRYPGDPCTPEAHEKAKRAYQADVALRCATYDVIDECPFYPKLKADFDRKITEGCK